MVSQKQIIMTANNTQVNKEKILSVFHAQKANSLAIGKTTARERIRKLQKLHDLVMKYRPEIREAMYKDYRKPAAEVDMTEIYVVTSEIKHAKANLRKWMSPHYVPTPLAFTGATSWVQYEPKGVCLIISPWNYPMQLTFGPLVSAVAAGNTVIIKPSEFTPHASAIMRKILEELFDESEVAFFGGGVELSTALLQLPFDHIFFTGSPQVGKIVMKAAANHLSSVTLELGGKSPTILDETANVKSAATRIIWGKFSNNGQICIAPDYLFVHESKKDAFLDAVGQRLKSFYGDDPATSENYMRIVNAKHYKRVKSYLDNSVAAGAKIKFGGQVDESDHYIAPTVVENVPLDSDLMQEEIFGPVLPVITYSDLQEVIDVINAKEKPLALYIYSHSQKNIDRIMKNTRAGGTCINNSDVHFFNYHLPFGGSNNSGIGKSHGKFGFEAFSNARAVYRQHIPGALELLLPPYTKLKMKLIDWTIKWF
jgi:aldehyde dehydrogenase (NAD+)